MLSCVFAKGNKLLVTVQTQPEDWSDQETLLLLEGLELHKDRWADIAEHVSTKSQVQCILHFLQLPIEDEFLDELEDKGRKPQGVDGPSEEAGPRQEGAASDDLIPFADTGNPILSQVRLLCEFGLSASLDLAASSVLR